MAQDINAELRAESAKTLEKQKKKVIVLSPKENQKLDKGISPQIEANTNNKTVKEAQKNNVVDTKPSTYNEKLAAERVEELKNKPIEGKFDAKHIKEINKYILQDSKELNGGQYRPNGDNQLRDRKVYGTDNTFKMQFEKGVVDDKKLNALMKEFGTVDQFSKLDEKMAADKLSKLYGDLEKLGAFEKANSKTARTYAEQIASKAGYSVDWTKINQYEKERAIASNPKLTIEPQVTTNEKKQVKEADNKQEKKKEFITNVVKEVSAVGKQNDSTSSVKITDVNNQNFMKDFKSNVPGYDRVGVAKNNPYMQGKQNTLNEVKISPSFKNNQALTASKQVAPTLAKNASEKTVSRSR